MTFTSVLIENNIPKDVLSQVIDTERTDWDSTCTSADIVECAEMLAGNKIRKFLVGVTFNYLHHVGSGIIAQCVAIEDGYLAGCIASEIGHGHQCFPCICDVLEYLGLQHCQIICRIKIAKQCQSCNIYCIY